MLKTSQRFQAVPFSLSHLDYFAVPAHAVAIAERSMAATLWNYQDDCASVAVGIAPYWPGVGMAWMHYNDVPGDGVAVARFVRQELHKISAYYRRIEAYVTTEDMRGRRFLEWLGFVLLLEKPQFGPQGQTMTECALALR